MDKKDLQDLVKIIGSLTNMVKEHTKAVENQTKVLREATDVMKNLHTRLASVVNAIGNGGTIPNN